MTLNETVAAIADAIREKTGKSELIAPVNFAEEIKGITTGGGSGGGDDGWEYYKVDSSFYYSISEDGLRNEAQKIAGMQGGYHMGAVVDGMLVLNGYFAYGNEMVGFKVEGDGIYYKMFTSMGITSFKALNDEAIMGELGGALNSRFIDALIPCTKEEFEALITE